MKKHRNIKKTAYFVITMLLVLGLLISGARILEYAAFGQDVPSEKLPESKTIRRDGIDYYPRQDVTVILLMGIDEQGPVISSGYHRNTGEADVVNLLILDETNETYTVLCLNRDTMLNMPVLGINGKQAGTFYGQLALAHTYGEGLTDSCENMVQAVSDFLHGIAIDYYVAMNMDAIAIVNDAVGGVRVNVTDDFSEVDSSIPMGQVVLSGSQALSYVQARINLGNQLNISRMERHKEYMTGLMDALKSKVENSDSFILNLHDQINEYMVTDCSVTTINSLLERCVDYSFQETVSLDGRNELGAEYYEFYADEEKLDEVILRLFYASK